jgi:hypothetical protein
MEEEVIDQKAVEDDQIPTNHRGKRKVSNTQ